MEGKDKCELLRMIRADIAKANNINLKPIHCDFKFCRTGTCELCEEEARYLEFKLNKKARNGDEIKLKGVYFDTLLDYLQLKEDQRCFHSVDELDIIQGHTYKIRGSEWDVEDKFKW